MNKIIILMILFIGILLITIAIIKDSTICRKERIIYRYIPRSFENEQMNEASVTDIFNVMFTQPSPWIASIKDVDFRKQEAINKFFISQV
jgi:hypothetical protein